MNYTKLAECPQFTVVNGNLQGLTPVYRNRNWRGVSPHANFEEGFCGLEKEGEMSIAIDLPPAMAKEAQDYVLSCGTILTEDLNDGQVYNGVRAVNPFEKEVRS